MFRQIFNKKKPPSLFHPMVGKGNISGVVILISAKDNIIRLDPSGYSNFEKQ
jgi:hypothetical protein